MNQGSRGAQTKRIIGLVGTIVSFAVAGTIVACTGDDNTNTFDEDAGVDAATDATVGTQRDAAGFNADSAAPDDATSNQDASEDDDDASSDAGDTDSAPIVDAAPSGRWAFTNYCGSAFATTCPALGACATVDGGIEATACAVDSPQCVASDPAGPSLNRIFSCLPPGPAWDVNALCASPAETCASGTPDACAPDDAAVFGTACGTPSGRCFASAANWICLSGDASIWMFDGYCDAGPTAACGAVDACPTVVGGIANSACTTPRAECVNNGAKRFVCTQR